MHGECMATALIFVPIVETDRILGRLPETKRPQLQQSMKEGFSEVVRWWQYSVSGGGQPTTEAVAKAATSGATMGTWWHSGSFSKLCRHPILFLQHLDYVVAESECVVFMHKGWQLVGWKLLVALLLRGDSPAVFRNHLWALLCKLFHSWLHTSLCFGHLNCHIEVEGWAMIKPVQHCLVFWYCCWPISY